MKKFIKRQYLRTIQYMLVFKNSIKIYDTRIFLQEHICVTIDYYNI